MRKALAVIVGIAGVCLAVYVGLWLMFVGGIAQLVDAAQEDPVEGIEIAIGIVRIVFASAATVFTLYGVSLLAILIGDGVPRRRRRR